VYGRRISRKIFGLAIVGIWAFAYFLTAIGVGMHGETYVSEPLVMAGCCRLELTNPALFSSFVPVHGAGCLKRTKVIDWLSTTSGSS
jgi:hypothetical protein